MSGGLEAIIKTPGENDLVAIAKHYDRDPKVFVIGIFDAVIMLKALTTVLEMTAPMLMKILPLTVESTSGPFSSPICDGRFGIPAGGNV